MFQFELQTCEEHLCIPMCVRLKLDCCGLKVTTQQWHRLLEQEKEQAMLTPSETAQEQHGYRQLMREIILDRTGERAGELLPEPNPAWLNEHSIPTRVQDAFKASDHDLTLEKWAGLTPLQRFALIKLTRPGHDMSSKFHEAMQEFGL